MTVQDENAVTTEASPVVLDNALEKARLDKGLSVDQVCARLRISARQVIAMEANDFDVLGDAMIVRGFIRNYAKLLELDPEPLVAQYMASKPNAQPRSLTLNSANIAIQSHSKQDWQKYVGMSVFIALLVAVWYFYTDYQANHASMLAQLAAKPVVQAPVEPSATASQSLPSEAAPSAQSPLAITNTNPSVVTSEAPPVASLADDNASVPSSPVRVEESVQPSTQDVTDQLRVNTGEASWVHVLDADNKVILDAIVPANGEALAEGKAPFSVVIGNAPVATIQFNQRAIDLTPYTKGRVARLKLE